MDEGWTKDDSGDLLLEPATGYQLASHPNFGIAVRIDRLSGGEPGQYIFSAERAYQLGEELIALARQVALTTKDAPGP